METVKKLDVTTSKENIDIESEVKIISNVHHRNIIRLLGCSGKGPVKLLVYKYMENGSIGMFLYALGKPQAVVPEESDAAGEAAELAANNQNKKKGMVLPFEPHSITFDDIKYSFDMPQEMKEQGVAEDRLLLLKGVSEAFRPCVLTALMGVSGAGKTTLMDVLAGRKTGGYIEGDVTVSGYPKKQETFARIAGYCEQNDIHSPHVTLYESLLYLAWLRLPSEVDTDKRKGSAKRLVKAALQEVPRKRETRYSDCRRIEKKVQRHFHDDIIVVVLFLNHDLIS